LLFVTLSGVASVGPEVKVSGAPEITNAAAKSPTYRSIGHDGEPSGPLISLGYLKANGKRAHVALIEINLAANIVFWRVSGLF
jgi:hypothetical protein